MAGLVTAVLCGLGILLLGLPGGFVFWLSTLLVLGRDGMRDLAPDAAWPVAIVMSLGFPLAVSPATWLVRRARPGWTGARVALAVAAITFAWAVALSLALHALGQRGEPGRGAGFWSA